MGCGQSKAAAAVVSSKDIPATPASPAGSEPKAGADQKTSAGSSAAAAKAPASKAPKTTTDRRAEFAIRPGYSSGASSYDGSVGGDDIDGEQDMRVSRHSDILALSDLRQEMVAEGDLTKTVVRIESSFGQPIEDVYDGVHDGPVLGSGVSGIVRLVTHRATNVKYAVKVLDVGLIDSTEGLRQLRNEIFIMCQLDHPNIVRIEEVYESTNEIYIVQELCLGGELFDRLDEQPDYHYTEPQCARLVKQMLSAVRYLHSKGIIHRDLKLENFLFSSQDVDSELKMIDFGLSKHFILGEYHNEQVGTPYTVAPEIINGSYDEKSDIWALGVIAYLTLSGVTPFGGLDGENLLLVKQNIMRAKLKFEPPEVWENVSSDGINFVTRLLQADPANRPTAKQAQKDPWIQVWAKKDAKTGNKLNDKTIGALMAFKEQSDMQKLLSEVLSFTLLPEQIVDLRNEFEKIDSDGDGEISLKAMKKVLLANAEVGALGALTEQEVEALFEAIRVRKTEPTIRWHEFLAAGLSQARVDDRNLRLAFDRIDTSRKGYVTLDDLRDMLGNSAESHVLEKIWIESLNECKAHLDRITFADFKRLMKGQPKATKNTLGEKTLEPLLEPVMEDEKSEDKKGELPEESNGGRIHGRSRSFDQRSHMWSSESQLNTNSDDGSIGSSTSLGRDASRAVLITTFDDEERSSHLSTNPSMTPKIKESPLLVNRALYRKHREMRISIMEASKQFDMKRKTMEHGKAGLIMKRGEKAPDALEDKHTREMFEAAAKRCGRARRTRNKTASDVTGMMTKAQVV
mmetsp:Transcript_5770/g.11541  ORF Transcript_5770/g.11541 Transcript_5770/m.11541 type:complete len:798 (-) Transcript_5770:24-2417(-)